VVRRLADAYRFYRDALGLPLVREAEVGEQGVRAALLAAGDSEVELLEPLGPDTPVGRFLARRGEGLHHVCFAVDDVAAELARLTGEGYEAIDAVPRWGHGGLVAFLHPRSTHGVLVELLQRVPPSSPADSGAGA
jgi:methylmalonyl-CoA/ethylmalonyl-CoA epimerase